ncbi:MAG: hypothetical protein IKC77_06625 [Lentisphaeria bacterium]|nr:hypothetical protein [Lentisphaeria bacterium]
MKWRYANFQAKEKLGTDPLKQMTDPQLVKENPVRQVFKCGKFFFKHDTRFFNGLRKEFRHAMKISARGIPVVEHLAVSRNWLVTESAENYVELCAFLRYNTPDNSMLTAFAQFIRKLKDNNLRHDDLHSGNVLYNADDNSFLLVDVCSADIVPSILKSPDSHFSYFALELRRNLLREQLYPVLKVCSERTPEEVFDTELKHHTVKVLSSWQKRKSQILSGYKKFVSIEDDTVFAADAPQDISNAVELESSDPFKYMLIHHFLELNHIPHRRIYAVKGGRVLLEADEKEYTPMNDAEFADFSERLAVCGISSSAQDWIKTSTGYKYINLASAIGQCDLLEH